MLPLNSSAGDLYCSVHWTSKSWSLLASLSSILCSLFLGFPYYFTHSPWFLNAFFSLPHHPLSIPPSWIFCLSILSQLFLLCPWASHHPVQIQSLPCSRSPSDTRQDWTATQLGAGLYSGQLQGALAAGFPLAATAKSGKEAAPSSCSRTSTAEFCQDARSDLALPWIFKLGRTLQ